MCDGCRCRLKTRYLSLPTERGPSFPTIRHTALQCSSPHSGGLIKSTFYLLTQILFCLLSKSATPRSNWQKLCSQPAPLVIAHCSCAVVTSFLCWTNKRREWECLQTVSANRRETVIFIVCVNQWEPMVGLQDSKVTKYMSVCARGVARADPCCVYTHDTSASSTFFLIYQWL